MKKHLALALLLAAFPLAAQEGLAQRVSVGGSLIATYGDYRAFTNKSMGFGAEVTYDLIKNTDPINLRGYLGYMTVTGNERPEVAATFDLSGMRVGFDFTFKTPMEALVPYAGFNVTKWTGKSVRTAPVLLDRQVDFSDKEPKFGFRFGMDYFLTKHLVVGADYSLSEWRQNTAYSTSVSNPKAIKGLNPVRPSWGTVTVRYHF